MKTKAITIAERKLNTTVEISAMDERICKRLKVNPETTDGGFFLVMREIVRKTHPAMRKADIDGISYVAKEVLKSVQRDASKASSDKLSGEVLSLSGKFRHQLKMGTDAMSIAMCFIPSLVMKYIK